jgi:hypothetical protein
VDKKAVQSKVRLFDCAMKSETSKGKRRWLRILSILFVFGAVWFFWARPDQWRFRRELPWMTKDIHERYWSHGFLPDYSYYLKARITEEQFWRYIAKFKLTPHTSTRQYSESPDPWLDWDPDPYSWWNPSKSLDSTFVWQGHDTWTFAKYERGYLYLVSLNH